MLTRPRALSLGLLFLGLALAGNAQAPERVNVYLLFGISDVGKWESSFAAQFSQMAEESGFPISIFTEYLGVDESMPANDQAKIEGYLRTKAKSFPPSLVVSALPGAGHFLKVRGLDVFGRVPKVYVIPKGSDIAAITLEGNSKILRSASVDAIGKTLQTMRDLDPRLKKVVVIGGSSSTDANYPPIAREILETHFPDLTAEYWIGDSLQEVLLKSSQLQRDSAILFTSMEMDRERHPYASAGVLENLTKVASAPVYSFYDSTMGSGIVGGNLTSSKSYATQAFSLGLQSLGLLKSPGEATASSYQFDARQLKRWSISESRLPEGSLVLFRESNFWSDYQGLILGTLALILLQLAWIVLLMRSNQRQKRTTAQLKESTSLLQSISDNFTAGMIYRVVIAPDGQRHFTYLSDSVLRLYGVTSAAAIADSSMIYSRIHPDDVDRLAALEEVSLKTLSVFQCEVRIRNPDLGYRWSLLTSTPHPQADGSTVWDGVEFLITDRKQAEEESLRLRAQLLAAQKLESIGAIAGGIAHDFNHLLAVMLTHLDLLALSLKDGPHQERVFKIQAAAKHSSALTRQLLSFAKVQSVTPVRLDINHQLGEMKDLLGDLLGEAHRLSFELQDEVLPVRIDPVQFDQIISNLCVNARDAMASPGQLTIKTKRESRDRPYALLCVQDTGSGMDEATIRHIFEPFFTTKLGGKGSGLGLSTVFTVVQQNGGFLEVNSQPGAGSEFRVWLPVDSAV